MSYINEDDVKEFLTYAKKNFKAVYLKGKEKFRNIIFCLIFFEIISSILFLSMLIFENNFLLFTLFLVITVVLIIFIKLLTIKYIDRIETKSNHMQVLKEYIIDKSWSIIDLKLIFEKVNNKIEEKKKNNLLSLMFLGVLSIPIWSLTIEYLVDISNAEKSALIVSLFGVALILSFVLKTLYIFLVKFSNVGDNKLDTMIEINDILPYIINQLEKEQI